MVDPFGTDGGGRGLINRRCRKQERGASLTCGWNCRGGTENTGMRRCGGFYIPFAPPGDPAPFPLRMKSRRIACGRTDHFCNFDGIAKTLFCCHRKRPALVVASSISFALPRAAELTHSAAPPLPTKSSILQGPRWQSLSAVSGRKRYNTLDFAGQNRVPKAGLPALLWKPPAYRQKVFPRVGQESFLPVFIFPACCKNERWIFAAARKNEKRAISDKLLLDLSSHK